LSDGFDAVLVIATLPVTAPAAFGLKVAVNVVLISSKRERRRDPAQAETFHSPKPANRHARTSTVRSVMVCA
jgi:hypothetical protein